MIIFVLQFVFLCCSVFYISNSSGFYTIDVVYTKKTNKLNITEACPQKNSMMHSCKHKYLFAGYSSKFVMSL